MKIKTNAINNATDLQPKLRFYTGLVLCLFAASILVFFEGNSVIPPAITIEIIGVVLISSSKVGIMRFSLR